MVPAVMLLGLFMNPSVTRAFTTSGWAFVSSQRQGQIALLREHVAERFTNIGIVVCHRKQAALNFLITSALPTFPRVFRPSHHSNSETPKIKKSRNC